MFEGDIVDISGRHCPHLFAFPIFPPSYSTLFQSNAYTFAQGSISPPGGGNCAMLARLPRFLLLIWLGGGKSMFDSTRWFLALLAFCRIWIWGGNCALLGGPSTGLLLTYLAIRGGNCALLGRPARATNSCRVWIFELILADEAKHSLINRFRTYFGRWGQTFSEKSFQTLSDLGKNRFLPFGKNLLEKSFRERET